MLWSLERKHSPGYDEYIGAVVRADSEQEAREIAASELYPTEVWTSLELVECKQLDEHGEKEVVFTSFKEG